MAAILGTHVQLDVPFDLALERTRAALKAEGFGILTEIDVRSTFKEKLGVEFRPYVILGACNPPLAHRALSADPEVGLLLPCNVTVEATEGGGAVVRFIDPVALLGAAVSSASGAIGEVASDAQLRLQGAARALGAASGSGASRQVIA